MNYTLNQMTLTGIYEKFHPLAAEYMFFSSAHKTFSRINHTLDQKSSLNKFNIEIMSIIFSDHNSRNQQKEKSWKIEECVEIKLQTPE